VGERREAPTLIVVTRSAEGLQDEHVEQLVAWADKLPQAARS
jgi:hypothetical protein